MATLKLADFKKGNWWVTFFVLAVVLVLFFIPDIVGFETSITDKSGNFSLELPKVASGREEDTNVQNIRDIGETDAISIDELEQILDSQDPLEQVSYLIDQGYIDHLADRGDSELAEAGRQEKSSEGLGSIFGPKESEQDNGSDEFIPSGQVNWTQLKSKRSKRILRKVQSECLSLSRSLDPNQLRARYAVLNLSAGIEKILGDAERSMTAKEAIDYLEYLDLTVTRAFIEDGVERSSFLAWSEISLAPVLGRQRANRMKKIGRPAFDPKLRLVQVQLKKTADDRGYPAANGLFFVGFRAEVRGREIDRVELYRDGMLVKILPLKPDKRNKDKFDLSFDQGSADGRYSFHIFDKNGEEYVKNYYFRKRAAFEWQYQRASNCYISLMPRRGQEDPRVDAVFRFQANSKDSFFSNDNVFTVF